MSEQTLQLKLRLEPVLRRDEESGFFVAHFKDFPQVVAYDETEHKAVIRLIDLFGVVLRNEREKIIEQLLHEANNESLELNMVQA
jgi:predicted RNase H-like HicB family nuclease